MSAAMIGVTLGSYVLTAKISEGGMGVVYRGEHTLLGRAAAIKVLRPAYSEHKEIVQRFFNEARATTAIKHPGIVEIYDFGYHTDGRAFIVMELLAGESLAARLRRVMCLDEDRALALVRAITGALAVAHEASIIHRDLKPDNVFLVPDADVPGGERPKLLDFGIAKLSASATTEGSATRAGMVMGTPAYMAPEQCRGAGEVDGRADLYAVGCILHELLSGRPPFSAEGEGEVMGMHMFVEPSPLRASHPGVSNETEALVLRLLAKEPAQRPASARQLVRELDAIAQSRGPTAPQPARTGPPMPTPVMAIATAPTTLGGAAAQLTASSETTAPATRSRMLGIAGGVVVACVFGVVTVTTLHGEESSPRAAMQPAAIEPRETPPPPPDAAVPAIAAPPIDAAVPALVVDAPPPRIESKKQPARRARPREQRDDFPVLRPATPAGEFPIIRTEAGRK